MKYDEELCQEFSYEPEFESIVHFVEEFFHTKMAVFIAY